MPPACLRSAEGELKPLGLPLLALTVDDLDRGAAMRIRLPVTTVT